MRVQGQSFIFSHLAWPNGVYSYTNDPYLAYRPPFVRSLPVQIMLTGIVLTLVTVLFIHLMFTAKYHWSLAPVNYVLQLSGVTTLLISLVATIHVVLSASFAESKKWPYMLSYIAVNVPPLDLDTNTEGWTTAERATWLVMTASTSALIQVNIYPSLFSSGELLTLSYSTDNSHSILDPSLPVPTGRETYFRPPRSALLKSLACFN
jgi:hypothetical protein